MITSQHRSASNAGSAIITRVFYALACSLLSACAATAPAQHPSVEPYETRHSVQDSGKEVQQLRAEHLSWPPWVVEPRWPVGSLLLQGFFGGSSFSQVQTQGGDTSVDGDQGDLSQLLMLGGGGQWKLAGDRLDFGLETLFSFSGRANATAFASGRNGAVLVVDADILLFDLYGGPFVNLFLSDNWRVYAAAGPVAQWADYHQTDNTAHTTSTGFGFGTYARTGFEFRLPSQAWLGLGVRWSKSQVGLDNQFGQLEIEGVQFMITVSEGV